MGGGSIFLVLFASVTFLAVVVSIFSKIELRKLESRQVCMHDIHGDWECYDNVIE